MIIKTTELQHYLTRPLTPVLVDELTQAFGKDGFFELSPIVVAKDGDTYFVICGNHRLAGAIAAGLPDLPCHVVDLPKVDWLKLAIRDNEINKTLKPDDLFDWLYRIEMLQGEGLTQEQIGHRIGKTQQNVAQYLKVLTVTTNVLDLAKNHQDGRVVKNTTSVVFNFTEGWFRNSGIYDLFSEYQMEFMEWFITAKTGNSGKKPKDYITGLKLKQDSEAYIADNLLPGAGGEQIIDNIVKGLYTSIEQVERAVNKANEQFLDRQKITIIHQDGLEMLGGIAANSVDCIITDPPYNVTDNEWDKFDTPDEYLKFLSAYLYEFKRILKLEYHLFIFADPEYMAAIEVLIKQVGFEVKSRIIWVRKNISMGRVVKDRFISQWEPIFHCGNKPLSFPKDWGDERGDVQEFAVPQSNFNDKKEHPTQKPLDLITRMIALSTDIGDMVVDPFCGSGTTAKACEALNRKCITSDIVKKYIDIAKIRVFGGL